MTADQMPGTRTIELLAPAGDTTCIRAAIENGADAIYFGLDRGFNARARATNISLDNLEEVMDRLRSRRVRGYLTLNTLVFSDELLEFENVVRQAALAGVDAVLVQDLGAARLIRDVSPDLSIHASTQMTLSSSECIAAVADLGVERVVLPRELSLSEIRLITMQTQIPVEVFVHGALCVAYSGQCLTSESLGGRSANRGQCAQACRLPYELYADQRRVDLGRQKYLLSPHDLAAFKWVPELIDAGVTSFKIEGRLKSPEYVASITAQYREAIDAALANRPLELDEGRRDEMELTFSRGLASGWLEGCDHKRLVTALSSAKRGLMVGTTRSVKGSRIAVQLTRELRPGDGIMFDAGRDQNEQPGGRVYEIWLGRRRLRGASAGQTVELAFRHGSSWISLVQPGQSIWKSDDPELTKRIRRTFEASDPSRRLPVVMSVTAHQGEPLKVTARVVNLPEVTVASDDRLPTARRHAANVSLFQDQLGRLGHTQFELASVVCDVQGAPMVPLSVLGKVRKELIARLDEQLRARPKVILPSDSRLDALRPRIDTVRVAGDREVQLHVLCRSMQQMELIVAADVDLITVDFADIRDYRHAVAMGRSRHVRVALATPRIQKPGELGILLAMARHEPDLILARNLAAIEFFRRQSMPCVADYSLNVANELAADYLMSKGVDRLTLSYDLNRDQLMTLLSRTPTQWLEVVIHQHMPMFHMEHCVFCAVLSPGTNKHNCGRPCDHHVVQLEDRVGMRHPLTADVGCRNTLFNAQPQSAAEIVPKLVANGVCWLRIELLEQSRAADIADTISLYQQLIKGTISGQQVLSRLNAANRVGVTRGTLEAERNPLAII